MPALDCFSLEAPTGTLLCEATPSQVPIGEYMYDRKSVQECVADEIHVEKGELFTIVAFFGERPMAFFPGPHMEEYASYEPDSFPMHTSWFFLYTRDDNPPVLEDLGATHPLHMGLEIGGAWDDARCF